MEKQKMSFHVVILLMSTLAVIVGGVRHTFDDKDFVCTSEQHRPQFHFSAQKNWINDPNGMVYYSGLYHLYFQYHPNGTNHGPMHWGHAASSDMVLWEEQEIALFPDELGTIFSGSAVVDTTNTTGFKKPGSNSVDPIVAIYTSAGGENHELQRQSIAYSLDSGFTFTKYDKNPVLNSSGTPDFRDPKVFYHDDRWVMSLAVKDRIEFYESPNLTSWSKLSEVGRNPKIGNHDGVWECPDLLPMTVEITDKQEIELWALLVSINPGGPNKGSATQYFIGNLTNNAATNKLEYHPYIWSKNQWLDWGPDNYAGVTFANQPKGRQIYMAWMSNWAYAEHTPNKVHRGQMTIPRELGIVVLDQSAQQYRIVSKPIPELESLRHPFQFINHSEPFAVLPQTHTNPIQLTKEEDFSSPLMELDIDIEVINNPQFAICANNDADEAEEVCFGNNGTHWYIDRSKSGNVQFNDAYGQILHAYAPREIKNAVSNIKIFLDVSSIEVFADGGLTTMTALHFPSKPFDRFYIKNLGRATSASTITVQSYRIWGLRCWFGGAGGESDDDGSGAVGSNITNLFSIFIGLLLSFVFRFV